MIVENVVGEEPVGTRPGSRFYLNRSPITGTTAVYAGGLRLRHVTSAPAVNEFTLIEDGGQLDLGWSLAAWEALIVDYDTMGFEATVANILALALDLCLQQGDLAQMADFADDVCIDLSLRGWLCELVPLVVASGQSTYTLPAEATSLLAAFYDDTELSAASIGAMGSRADWRARPGRPRTVVRETEADRTARVFPVPNVASAPAGANPLGDGFPVGAIHLLVTEKRTTLPEWLALPAALLVLAREFARESDHRDLTFAGACQQLADAYLDMVS